MIQLEWKIYTEKATCDKVIFKAITMSCRLTLFILGPVLDFGHIPLRDTLMARFGIE